MGANAPRMSKKEMAAMVNGVKKIGQGIKNYGKNVVGGAKIVGGALKKAVKWPMDQIEKEWRGEDKAIEDFRYKQKRRELDLD